MTHVKRRATSSCDAVSNRAAAPPKSLFSPPPNITPLPVRYASSSPPRCKDFCQRDLSPDPLSCLGPIVRSQGRTAPLTQFRIPRRRYPELDAEVITGTEAENVYGNGRNHESDYEATSDSTETTWSGLSPVTEAPTPDTTRSSVQSLMKLVKPNIPVSGSDQNDYPRHEAVKSVSVNVSRLHTRALPKPLPHDGRQAKGKVTSR
ncbi:hypothetical protein EKO27_g6146 [Xylaria grammica]|uniref:Uncharacterized protein n=1 Tax=Xylaria grammica TaxID=363999 RepID=A0A439D3H8_9PEZI|nr:hypothetical protein EKO27_g6146 [Xylaria grammica]